MNKLFYALIITFLLTSSLSCFSQYSTDSPYSYYGIGEFELSDHSRTSGMGGVGIGMKSDGYINFSNPASYSSIDSLNVIFDFALSGSKSRFESASNKYSVTNGNIKKIAVGLRLYPRWALSLGLMPYTNVGYEAETEKGIEGTTDFFNITNKGEGGFSKIFIGNSFKINHKISAGINSNFLIGYIEKSETYTYQWASGYWQQKTKYKPKTAVCFDFGLQYADSLNSKWLYTLGFTGGVDTKLKLRKYIAYDSDTSTYTTDEFQSTSNFWIPAYGGFGFSLSSSRWLFAADYRIQFWDNVSNKNDLPWLTNSHHAAVGAQYIPRKIIGRSIFERMSYQVGAHFDRSYLRINSENFDIYGVTFGLVVPFRNQMSNLGISVDVGKKGRLNNGMFKENYIQVNLLLNMSDIWFLKRKFD